MNRFPVSRFMTFNRPICVATMRLCLAVILSMGAMIGHSAAQNVVKNVRIGVNQNETRLVLELGQRVDFNIFTLDKPRRVVVDLPTVKWPSSGRLPKAAGAIQAIRYGQFTQDKSRLVVDLSAPAIISKSFLLKPISGFPYRLVIDIKKTSAKNFARQVAADRVSKIASAKPRKPAPPPRAPSPSKRKGKRVVVIDAGHGGVDPGARGRKAREKNITLTFAREFAKRLHDTGRYKVRLTRNRDIYIPLRDRVAIARRHNADLFISIHADAIKKKSVRGMSIYTLSETASDKEAAELARQENRSDIIAGMDFDDNHDRVTTGILIDLAQRETKNLSVKFANLVVDNARGSTRLLDRTHRFAGFRVLKAPDVPSVLIELGFLTNRSDERQLLSKSWRRKIARTLVRSVDKFFASGQFAFNRN